MSTTRLDNLKKQIQLNGNIRDVIWVTKQFRKGRIKIYDENHDENILTSVPLISETIFNQFKTCVRVINDIYENAWDIAFEIKKNSENKIFIEIKGIYILFPEINITNRNRKNHLIKDLLVLIQFCNLNNNTLKIFSLKGGRLSLSYAEYQSDYFHSHLSIYKNQIVPNISLPLLRNFCTGSGEINIYQSEINGDGFTEERFMRYAMQILSLVSYESIEGVPYRHLEKISVSLQGGHIYYTDATKKTRFKRKVLDYYRDNDIIPKIDIVIDSSNSYSIVDNESLQKFVLDINYTEEEKRDFFCSCNNNIYYTYGNVPQYSIPPNINTKFIFRGEEKSFNIEPAPSTTDVVNYIIHPDLIKYLKEEIEYELNKNKIRQSTIDRYTPKLSDATESIQSNPVPVPANS